MIIDNVKKDFFYEDGLKFNPNNFILAIKDEDFPDRYILPTMYFTNNHIEKVNDSDLEKLVVIPHNSIKDKPLSRFNLQQLIKLSYGWISRNSRYNDSNDVPKYTTIDSYLSPADNQIIEFFEGELNEEDSLFTPQIEFFQLFKEVYLETENVFFVIDKKSLIGPFKVLNFNENSFKIVISNNKPFGEYHLTDESYIEFNVNAINRKIFINDCIDLKLTFKKDYDFISDDDLLEKFGSELKNYPEYFNENNLENVLTVLKKSIDIGIIEKKFKNNSRLKKILERSGDVLDKDIDLLKNIPEIKKLKEDKKEIEEQLFNYEKELEKFEIRKNDLLTEIQKLEQTKTEELEKRKKELDQKIEELEFRKNNLEKEVEKEKAEKEQSLQQIKDEIDKQRIIEEYLKAGVKKLQDEFTSEQKDAQYKLAELVKGKTHFDFISGRDLSEQGNESFQFLDFQTIDQFNQNQYRDFRTELVNILKQKNRNFDNHFVDNLLISIYQNTLTVFAGKPGTGKTTLARYLTNILAPEDKIREVSVNRGWTSQKDFIGFVNPLTKKFHQSSTNTYTLLKQMDYETEKDIYLKTPMAFIILDEANLSPLEHYWSSFYNLTDSSGKLKIQLGHKEEVSFFDNLRFIGTINYDHTTEELSPRVLDRINIIQLPKNDDDNFNFSNSEIKRIQLTYERCKNFFEVDNKISESTKTEKTDKIINQYKEIRDEFKKLKINISPRVGQAIKKYIIVASEYMSDVNKPLDYCVAQRLLPLINLQGSENRQKLDLLKEKLENNKCDISAAILGDILNIGSEKGIYEENFNYFLTLSNV